MSIAVVIGTHGSAAEQLLQAAEIIVGKQNNVTWVDLLPGENAEIMIDKYTKCLTRLAIKQGVLFLVDIWGGTPFNAASQIIINKKNQEIVTGVNIPMLVEVFMNRDDDPSFQKLVDIAIESGCTSIKSLQSTNVQFSRNFCSSNLATPKALNERTIKNKSRHMKISLARIDDRLIHGQVVTYWAKETKVKRIIVINDQLAQDMVRKTLIVQATPPGITAHVVSIEKVIRVYHNPKYADERVMFLFTNPTDIVNAVKLGLPITSVNVGGMAFQKGKIQVNNAISLDIRDIESFKTLDQLGINLEVRKVPNDPSLRMMDLINKNKKLN